jgi:hypothetical protein
MGKLSMEKEAVLVSLFIIVIGDMKANGNAISRTAKDISNFRMAAFIKAITLMGNLKDLGNINGLMGNIMKENGLMDLSMALALGMG